MTRWSRLYQHRLVTLVTDLSLTRNIADYKDKDEGLPLLLHLTSFHLLVCEPVAWQQFKVPASLKSILYWEVNQQLIDWQK